MTFINPLTLIHVTFPSDTLQSPGLSSSGFGVDAAVVVIGFFVVVTFGEICIFEVCSTFTEDSVFEISKMTSSDFSVGADSALCFSSGCVA